MGAFPAIKMLTKPPHANNLAVSGDFGNQRDGMEDIAKFIEGFREFKANYFAEGRGPGRLLFDRLREGQRPKSLIIGCSDSRVDPAILFGCDPGDLFVVRNVANLVPPCEEGKGYHGVSAALEFGVLTLEVRHIIVLGHAHCGGIGALMSGQCAFSSAGFIENWMKIADGALEKAKSELPGGTPEELARACEQAAILVSLENLRTFPWIRARVDAGLLMLVGWYFDIEDGSLYGYSEETGRFELIA